MMFKITTELLWTNLKVSKSDSLSSCWKCLLRQRFLCILRTSSSAPTYSDLLVNPLDLRPKSEAKSSVRTGGKAQSSNLNREGVQICEKRLREHALLVTMRDHATYDSFDI